jgi:chromosome segregation ATPase
VGNKEKFDLLEGVDKKTTELLRQITENDEVLDEELREHEEEAEVLALAVDKLKAEVEREDEELERRKELLDRAEAENETLKVKVRCLKEMRSSLSKAALEEQLRRRIKEEKVNNKKLKEDMKQIQEEIDLLLFKRFKEYAIAEDLQRSAKKIFDLELSLDNTRISYLEDQQKLTPTQKSLKNKQDALEKLADRVSKDFRSVTSKFAEMNIERSVLQKKVKRLEDLSLKLEEDLRKIDKKLSKVEKFNQISSTNPTKLLRSGSVRASLTLRQLKLSVESEFPD